MHWQVNCVSIRHYFKLSSCPNSNRDLSASVPLTATTQAIREIEVLCMNRLMNQTVVQGQEWKQLPLRTPWLQGYIIRSLACASVSFFPIQEQRYHSRFALCF